MIWNHPTETIYFFPNSWMFGEGLPCGNGPFDIGGGINYINILTQRDLISRVEVDTYFFCLKRWVSNLFDSYASLAFHGILI